MSKFVPEKKEDKNKKKKQKNKLDLTSDSEMTILRYLLSFIYEQQ